MKTVSAADANRHFSKILREVKAGTTVLVTSRGEPVARIESIREKSGESSEDAAKREAMRKLLARLDAQPARNLGRFNRDEAYD